MYNMEKIIQYSYIEVNRNCVFGYTSYLECWQRSYNQNLSWFYKLLNF